MITSTMLVFFESALKFILDVKNCCIAAKRLASETLLAAKADADQKFSTQRDRWLTAQNRVEQFSVPGGVEYITKEWIEREMHKAGSLSLQTYVSSIAVQFLKGS